MNESGLFDYLKENYIPDLEATEQYSNFDCSSKTFQLFIELKCREVHYDTLMIEKYKYDRLIKLSQEKLYTPYYINSTPNGVYAFKLIQNPKWIWKLLPKTTQFKETQAVLKEVSYLDLKDAKKL